MLVVGIEWLSCGGQGLWWGCGRGRGWGCSRGGVVVVHQHIQLVVVSRGQR